MRVERLNGISVVALDGDLDVESARKLENLLDDLAAGGKKTVIVDMTEAGFVGNSVISVLLGSVGRMRKSGGNLKMCGVPDTVNYIFDILEVAKYLDTFEDRIGALISCPEKTRHHLSIQDRRKGTNRRKANFPFQGENRRRKERRRSPSQGPGLGLPALVFA